MESVTIAGVSNIFMVIAKRKRSAVLGERVW